MKVRLLYYTVQLIPIYFGFDVLVYTFKFKKKMHVRLFNFVTKGNIRSNKPEQDVLELVKRRYMHEYYFVHKSNMVKI